MWEHIGEEELDDIQRKLHIFYICKLVSSWGYIIKDFGVTINLEGDDNDVEKIYKDLLEIICGEIEDTSLVVDDLIDTKKAKRKLKTCGIDDVNVFVIKDKDIEKYLNFCKKNKYKDKFLYKRVKKLSRDITENYCCDEEYCRSLINNVYNIEIYYRYLYEVEDMFFVHLHDIIEYCKQKNRLLEMI